jgi:hypothetical protein
LANTAYGNAAPKSTPRKGQPKTTPKKQAIKNGSGEDDDDEGSSFETPSKKKTPLNKVKGGRVQKNSGRSRTGPLSYAEPEDDEEDYEEGIVKNEMDVDELQVHSNGYGNGNGYHNGGIGSSGYGLEEEDDAEQFHDVREG